MMSFSSIIPKHVDNIPWQDYRGSDKGMVIYYNTDPVSEMPIREVPDELPTDIVPEPNYETLTWGLNSCSHAKIRTAFVKSKLRYLFFMTKYTGANYDFMDQLMITGYYRIYKTANAQKLHIRHLENYSCIGEETCVALRADEAYFLSLNDAFILTPKILESWGATSRITRQTRIILDKEKTAELLEYFNSKTNRTQEYIDETERLWPATDEDEDESFEEEMEDMEDFSEEDAEIEDENVQESISEGGNEGEDDAVGEMKQYSEAGTQSEVIIKDIEKVSGDREGESVVDEEDYPSFKPDGACNEPEEYSEKAVEEDIKESDNADNDSDTAVSGIPVLEEPENRDIAYFEPEEGNNGAEN